MRCYVMEKSFSGGGSSYYTYAPTLAGLGYYGYQQATSSRTASQPRVIQVQRKKKAPKWANKLQMRRRARAPRYKRRNPRGRGRRIRRTRPLTSQNDNKLTYVKRRLGRRARRRAKQSYRRFSNQMMKREPANIFPYVHVAKIQWVDNTSKYFGALMGLYGHDFYDNNFAQAWDSITGGNAANVKAGAAKFRVDSMSLRVVIRNVTTVGEGTSATPTIDLDVFEVMCIRDIPEELWADSTGIESFLATQKNLMRQPTGMDIEVGTGGTGIPTSQQNAGSSSSNQVVGDTLFNNPMALRYWRVVRAMKIQLPSDGITEFEVRDSGNHTVIRQQCFDFGKLAARAYVTRGFIFNVNGRVFFSEGTNIPNFSSGTLNIETYVRYNIKEISGKSPTLVYDGI